MRRSHTIRRAVATIAILVVFMVVLRVTRSQSSLEVVPSVLHEEVVAKKYEEMVKAIESDGYDAANAYKMMVESEYSSPVVIFSKSYCPHSARAKTLLLEKYIIKPPPRVIELDLIGNGAELQQYIGEVTGRRTVPNILINGVSRGGASDMYDLGDDLLAKFQEWSDDSFLIMPAEDSGIDKGRAE